jgi:hypothetical protein
VAQGFFSKQFSWTTTIAAAIPLLLVLAAGAAGCKAKVPAITEPFEDGFDRAEVGPTWNNTGGPWRIADGKLNVALAHNHPLWLRRKLPADVVVEIDAMSSSPDGDLKVELFGDGQAFDPDGNRYENTGYIFVFGGWGNTESIIGRLGEHDAEVKARRSEPRVEVGKTYRWTITRRGGQIDWAIDGAPFLSFTDPQPLHGDGHQYFGIGNWKTNVYYDNLRIRPAK